MLRTSTITGFTVRPVWDKKGPNRSMFPIVPEFFTSNVWNFEFKLGN
jgi:hypothetical protein